MTAGHAGCGVPSATDCQQGTRDMSEGFTETQHDEHTEIAGDQEAAIRRVANDLHRLNESIVRAVKAGVTIELLRTSRYHGDAGTWGDQMTPIIKQGG